MKTDFTVSGFIFNRDEVLLIRHKKLNLWLPVGGHVDPSEIPDDAMIREAKEEAGLNVRVLHYPYSFKGLDEVSKLGVPFYANKHSVGDHEHACYFYVCVSGSRDITLDGREVSDLGWFGEEGASARYGNKSPDKKGLVRLAFKTYRSWK
jgi:8-oxo-dGTP pyrophosphatase MutT (NUDIX family)